MRSLFITGASGFIGRRLIDQLDARRYRRVVCLTRRELETPLCRSASIPARVVRADLTDPRSYASALAECDTVVHLAAATGRASRAETFAVNADGTRWLVEQCERVGVRDFLLVSTIAVRYPNARRYPYAASKQLAETAVRQSGLRHAIIRPTIVLGHDAPIWRSLAGLARRRVIVMPGSGGVRMQPIHVDDVIGGVGAVLDHDLFGNTTFELGGPDVATFEDFLRRVHRLIANREPSVIHVPLAPIMAVLSALEPALGRRLPITAGQLSAFAYDSAVDPALTLPELTPSAAGLDDMIRKCLADG